MAYSDEERYVLGLMARDAAAGRDGWETPTEQQASELNAFSAMALDKENNPYVTNGFNAVEEEGLSQ